MPTDHNIHGMIAFLFACYSGGCPSEDNYFFNSNGSKIPVAPAPLSRACRKRCCSRGALAVIAHVDRAFTYTFEDLAGTPQCQTLRTPLERLMKGQPVGLAADALNLQWSTLAAQLGMALGGNTPSDKRPQPPFIANLYIARDDARNYMVLAIPRFACGQGSGLVRDSPDVSGKLRACNGLRALAMLDGRSRPVPVGRSMLSNLILLRRAAQKVYDSVGV